MSEKTTKIHRLKMDLVNEGLLERQARAHGRTPEEELQHIVDEALQEIALGAIADSQEKTH